MKWTMYSANLITMAKQEYGVKIDWDFKLARYNTGFNSIILQQKLCLWNTDALSYNTFRNEYFKIKYHY